MVNRQLAPGIDFFFLITSWGKGGELSPGFPPWETEKCHWAIRLLAAVGIEVDLLSTVLLLQLMWDAYFLAKEEKDGYYLQIANPSAVSRFPSNGSIWLTLHHLEREKIYRQWPIFALVYFHMLMRTSYPNYFFSSQLHTTYGKYPLSVAGDMINIINF